MLIRSSLAYVLARGLPGLVNLAALALYSRLLSPEEYGRYALVIAGVMLVGMIAFQWQRAVVLRWLPARYETARQFLGESACLFLGLALVSSAIGAVIVLHWPDPVWQRLMGVGVPLLVAQGWFELNLTLAQARLTPVRYGALLGGKSVVALGVGGALAFAGLGAIAPLIGLLAGTVLAVALFGIPFWRDVQLKLPADRDFRQQLDYGLPLILTFALGWIIASSDRLLVGWLLGVDAAALYAVGYDLAQYSLSVLLVIVYTAAYPLAVSALERRGRAAAIAQSARNGELIVTVALAGAAVLTVLAPELVGIAVGAHYRETAVQLVPWIALSAALGGIKAFHFDMAFHLGRSSGGLLMSSMVAALANVALNLLLIPRFGVLGAAYASAASLALATALSAQLGRRVFALPAFAPMCLRAGAVALIAASGALAAAHAVDGVTGLVAGAVAAASTALAGAFLMDLGGLRAEALRSFRRFTTA